MLIADVKKNRSVQCLAYFVKLFHLEFSGDRNDFWRCSVRQRKLRFTSNLILILMFQRVTNITHVTGKASMNL